METLTGCVGRVLYTNEKNGYTVFTLLVTGSRETTCVGFFTSLSEGENLALTGEYVQNPKYGKQFSVKTYEERLPEDKESIGRYLASGAIRGIGEILAMRLVATFGNDTLRVMEEEPEKLVAVKGISLGKAKDISEQVKEKSQSRHAMMFLAKYGITPNLAKKIVDTYGDRVYQVLQENPYQMAEDIPGVGFRTADDIANRIGIHQDSDYRIKCGLNYILTLATGEGHVYLPRTELFEQAEKVLDVPRSYMEKHLTELHMERKVVIVPAEGDEAHVYPQSLYRMEKNVSLMLRSLNESLETEGEEETLRQIRAIEKEDGVSLDEHQREAVLQAARCGLLVLTGGPGTGKTTTIRTMIHYFEENDLSISLAAPTGRAAKRMGEATGREAQTIHRLLEFTPKEEDLAKEKVFFQRNRDNPLEAEVVIIDEMSMVDITLMHSLLLAITPGTRLILVGDENQLPSVGPGNVLKDIIASGVVPVVELTRIFRQAGESDIVVNAHKIIRGERVEADNKSKDFFLLRRYEAEKIVAVTLALVGQKLPPYVGVSSREIQVLTPMRKGVLGVEGLNAALQAYLNPPAPEKKEREVGDRIFREGDKVMQIRNNYELPWRVYGRKGIAVEESKGVFNGDMGTLLSIDEEDRSARVEFEEGRIARYEFEQMEELELAYAITIHKSQGSEYPAVVLPLLTGPALLLNRNLLYTAVTRAKTCVTIVGSDTTFAQMIRNERQMKRYSTLDVMLMERYE